MNSEIPTSERLVLAAIPLIWRHGYSAVSVDAICKAAGAHKGSFYHAFPSKTALLTRAIDVIWERDGAELRSLAAPPGKPSERLNRYLDWNLENQQRLMGEMAFVPGHFHMSIDITVPEAAMRAALHRAEAKAILDSLLKDALESRSISPDTIRWLVNTIGTIVSGLMIEARLNNSLQPVQTLKPTILRLLDHVMSGKDRS